jgi:hypothetical protein
MLANDIYSIKSREADLNYSIEWTNDDNKSLSYSVGLSSSCVKN